MAAQVGGVDPNPLNVGGRLNFITAKQGTAQLLAANGQVAATLSILAGSFGIDLPIGLEPGVYALRINSTSVEGLVIE